MTETKKKRRGRPPKPKIDWQARAQKLYEELETIAVFAEQSQHYQGDLARFGYNDENMARLRDRGYDAYNSTLIALRARRALAE